MFFFCFKRLSCNNNNNNENDNNINNNNSNGLFYRSLIRNKKGKTLTNVIKFIN